MPSACSPARSVTPANNVLFYVKGGAAVTANRYPRLRRCDRRLVADNANDTRWGGAVGVGLEYGFAPNWSAGVEYDHLFMQDRTYSFVSSAISGVAGRAPIASARTSISSPSASTIAGAARSSRSTDLS